MKVFQLLENKRELESLIHRREIIGDQQGRLIRKLVDMGVTFDIHDPQHADPNCIQLGNYKGWQVYCLRTPETESLVSNILKLKQRHKALDLDMGRLHES